MASQLGGVEVIDAARVAHDKITEVHRSIAASSSFTFLSPADFKRLMDAGDALEAEFLWRQVHQLLLLVTRSASDATCSLIEGISWCIGAANELTLALTVRAFVEHAASVEFLRSRIGGERERLRNTIWPSLETKNVPPVSIRDRAIHAELLRFAVGREMDSLPPVTKNLSEWARFYDDLYQSCAKLRPEYKPRHVKDYINPLKFVRGKQHFPAVYKRLCEYCHPNAASRLLDFEVEQASSGQHHISARSEILFSPGFQELFGLARQVVPASCEMLVQAIEEFSACWMPIPPLDECVFSKQPPQIGSITAYDQHGRRIRVPLDQIDVSLDPKRMVVLTTEQEVRLSNLYDALKELLDQTRSEWLDGFRMDGPYVEEEIKTHERVLQAYREETAERNANYLGEQKYIYDAICQCTFAESIDDLVSQMPSLKSMANLDRLFQRVKRSK